MALSERIGFIGGGNMASALIEGLLATGTASPKQLIASDVRAESLVALAQRYGIETTPDNLRACRADVVILSLKPQVFPALLPQIAPALGAQALIISIAAGVPLRAIEAQLGPARVLRAMPNTPALVSAGATALAQGTRATASDVALGEAIFASVGQVVRVDERHMDAVTALSGSGPAYVFALVEALIEASVALGLPADVAERLAAQTILGAGKLLCAGDASPSELRKRVTSPGGTTEAGLAALQAHGFGAAVQACVRAACERGHELGERTASQLLAAKPGA